MVYERLVELRRLGAHRLEPLRLIALSWRLSFQLPSLMPKLLKLLSLLDDLHDGFEGFDDRGLGVVAKVISDFLGLS